MKRTYVLDKIYCAKYNAIKDNFVYIYMRGVTWKKYLN